MMSDADLDEKEMPARVIASIIQRWKDRGLRPEKVGAALTAAAGFVDPERIIACTNCGMAPLPRHVAEGKLKALGAGADLFRKSL